MKKSVGLISIICILISGVSWSDVVDPNLILKKTVQNYHTMTSYKAEGESIVSVDRQTKRGDFKTSFTILLSKPNLYKITWPQNRKFWDQESAVWNAGDKPYLYMGMLRSYSEMTNDEMALAGATGISGGGANTIPSLFFKRWNYLENLTDLSFINYETINNENCYLIKGKSHNGEEILVWISVRRNLFIKIKQLFDGIEQFQEMSDNDIKKYLELKGRQTSKENIENMKYMMKLVHELARDTKGSTVEFHKDIVIDQEYDKKDFDYQLPEGAVLRDSLF